MKATQHYSWVLRDATETEKSGIVLPPNARKKPHTGKLVSVGSLVKDQVIKDARRNNWPAIFHQGIGQEIEFKGITYLILEEQHIIGVDDEAGK